ncbi:MAG TPA: DUF2161 family putative PD-(D/E)XK-type phosphodiesterase [Clostridia bacterium]|nr:DUF2161 family putative PD-(D/E)XK-type phosphodiesterase [Clostridia bacterium]
MAKRDNIRETDLYKPVHDYLEALGYQVQGEVKGCDLAAIMGDDLVVVELKTAFNLKLLSQAVRRQRVTDSVYVAIPLPKGGARTAGWRDMCMLLRRLELGLITVALNREENQVEVHFHPNTFDRLRSLRSNKKVRSHIIKETVGRSGQYNTGGATRTKLMTAYREQAVHIACCMIRFGDMSPARLKKLGTSAKTPNILRDNHYGWFTKVSKGLYSLNDTAREFLDGYPELVKHYMELITEKETALVAAVTGEAEVQYGPPDIRPDEPASQKKRIRQGKSERSKSKPKE